MHTLVFVTRLGLLCMLKVLFLRLFSLLSAHKVLYLLTHTVPLFVVTVQKDLPFLVAKSLTGFLSQC